MKITLPRQVESIISTLEAAGYEAFVVGGCVRDILRGVAPKDWDVATSATPVQAKALFSHTIDTGIKHGTITVVLSRKHYEVTTYRVDGEYLDGRRPETVEFVSNIEEDLSRRDFTINAIAYNPRVGFVDPFGGQEDIQQKIIRCVGEPKHRFTEDALRMLRAIRFSGETDFAVCENALHAIFEMKENLNNVSAERIRVELGKLITSPYPQAVKLLQDTGLMYYVLRGRKYGGKYQETQFRFIDGLFMGTLPLWTAQSATMFEITSWLQDCPPRETMRMALFLHWADGLFDDCADILRDLRFDNKTIKEVSVYVKWVHKRISHNRYEIKKIMGQMPHDWFENLVQLQEIIVSNRKNPSYIQQKLKTLADIRREAADIIQQGECFNVRGLAVNGDDLAAMGIPKGKKMGEILKNLLDAVMRDPLLNTKDALLNIVITS